MISIHTSTVDDGTMKTISDDSETAHKNRIAYLEKNFMDPAQATLHRLTYGGDDYCRYRTLTEADKGDGIARDSTIIADAVVVTQPGHAVLLPLADCIGAVIHDATKDILMLSHLGRHNLKQFGGTKSVEYLQQEFDCNPTDLTIWLSPAADSENYPLYAFDNRSLHSVAIEQLRGAGVPSANITSSPIDVTKDETYFSHSQFLKGNRKSDGRFAVVTMMQAD